MRTKLALPAGYTYRWAGEYEFELRAKERLKLILPVVLFVIFMLLYMIFKSATEAVFTIPDSKAAAIVTLEDDSGQSAKIVVTRKTKRQ